MTKNWTDSLSDGPAQGAWQRRCRSSQRNSRWSARPGSAISLTYDPRPTLAKVHCPVLALVGEKDRQVPARENLSQIESTLKTAGNNRVTVKELPGLNHLFQKCQTGAPAEYAEIEETIDPSALSRDRATGSASRRVR